MRNIFLLMLCSFFAGISSYADSVNDNNTLADAKKLFKQGLPKDALEMLRPFLLSGDSRESKDIAEGVVLAADCMFRLNKVAETEKFLEDVLKVHQTDWRVVNGVITAWQQLQRQSYGSFIDNTFQRGKGGGQRATAVEHDRIRILQLYVQAVQLAEKDENKSEAARLYLAFAGQWNTGWKMQILTDISTVPDYSAEDNMRTGTYNFRFGGRQDAPVDEEGNPVLYHLPESFEKAKNDGERWRWCLRKASELNNDLLFTELQQRAIFAESQFGEGTLQQYSFFRNRNPDDEANRTASIWNLESLKDNEVIAKLANGINRFELSEEFHYIALYKQCNSWENLARISQNRMQYEKAVAYYEKQLAEKENSKNYGYIRDHLNQITGNWGRFDTAGSDVKGAKPFLRYIFRNGKKVHLTATEIKIPELLNDIKEYLKSKPKQLDWQKIQIEQIGINLIFDRQENKAAEIREKYLGKEVAAWDVPLKPAEKFYDDAVQIDLNVGKSGAFLVKAEMENGNTQYAVVWLTDTAIVQKQLDKALLYYVADSQTGQPLEDISLDFFGYRTQQRYETVQNNRQRQTGTDWIFNEFNKTTDKSGFVILNQDEPVRGLNFLITAKTTDGKKRFTHLGFSNIWFAEHYDEQYNETKTFFITDRPVYRPGDTVKYKFWVSPVKYDQPEKNDYAGKQIQYQIHNPKKETTEKTATLDNYGGYAGELELPKDCPLGVFNVEFDFFGGGTFRVEEYKKPEYEVLIDAPAEPVALGEKFTVKIKANYYFGSPVSEATVKYKVLREKADANWYPVLPWDWFYGNGYGWFSYDTPWLPGFFRWGCCRPASPWNPHYPGPPEVVAEAETKIKPDGTIDIPVDTSLAKALFPDDSQRYTITAEVIDNSRRTITGTGTVLVAKEPFKIYAWTDKGHYVENQKIAVNFQARRLDGKAVSGEGEVKLYRLSYDTSLIANETSVYAGKIKFSDNGQAAVSLNAATAGQYRVSCVLNGQEGGYVFNVYEKTGGKVAESSEGFRYNALELIPDKTEYKTGEQVQLRINTNRENAAVLLFLKPANGVASMDGNYKPQLIQMKGKSQIVSVPVELRDMPNFFVEALSVSDGTIADEVKEIAVPPLQKILNVNIKPSSENYKPGEKAKAEIAVTDLDGKPVVGQTVVSIYDKSVEYISGGTNVGDIKEFFWEWRRHHYPQNDSNLDKYTQIFGEPNKPDMQNLGIFGYMVPGRGTEHFLPRENVTVMGGMGGGMMLDSTQKSDADAVPMVAAAPMSGLELQENAFVRGRISGTGVMNKSGIGMDKTGGAELVQPAIRKNFADTAFWVGALETDNNGKANIELTMPESLTTWKINVWDMSSGTRVGYGSTEVITRKNLIIRMQTPRFLVEKDKCVFTANVHNYLAAEKEVKVELNVDERLALTLPVRTVKIPANGEARVDWEIEAKIPGDAVITMKALTDEESDAMQKTLPVYVHGILKQEAWSGYIVPDKQSQTVEITIPAERKQEQTKLTVRFSPTLAASMIDALPYLTDYPYGCTEQTLNRFLPTVIVKKILTDMNMDLTKIKDIKTNLNAQELGENRQQDRKAGYARILEKRKINPVFDSEQVTEMVRDGVTKLTNGQNSDGGWGWFSGDGSHSSAHLTALTVHGLRLAKANDVAVNDDAINRGIAWLQRYQEKQVELLKTGELPQEQRKDKHYKTQADNTDAFVYMVLSEISPGTSGADTTMKNYLWRDRGKLSLYAAAMFGIALSSTELSDREINPAAIVKILEQYLVQDNENQTAYLDLRRYNNWCWWYWYGSEFETQTYYLKLLMRTDPKSPVAPQLVKYLLNNRRHATYWNSTRDTAIVIEAFAEFLKATGEDKPDMTVEVLFDGQVKKSVKITPENLFEIDNTLVLSADEITSGKHKIELQKRAANDNSPSPLYFNAYLENFSLEDPILKAGLEVKIERCFYKLERDTSAKTQTAGGRGQVVDIKTEKYNRIPFSPGTNGADIVSGDLIEVELIVESKNDYESILIEDRKAAGLEPIDVRSGYLRNTNDSLYPYVEFRDERVAFFVEHLPQGKHSLTYRLRAEQPGKFSALPAKVEAMYAPELKGNSDENKVNVTDK